MEILIGRRGFSLQEFAQEVGVSARALFDWRNSRKVPTPIHKARIVEVLCLGRDDPTWEDPAFRELAICLGMRRAESPEAGNVSPVEEDSSRKQARFHFRTGVVAVFLLAAIGALAIIAPCDPPTLAPDEDPPTMIFASGTAPWRLELASGKSVPLEATPRNGSFSFDFGDSLHGARLVDLDGDGKLEAVVVCLDTAQPERRSGQVRISCFSSTGDSLWTRWIDDAPTFGAGSSPHSAHGWSLVGLRWLDWRGDRKTAIALLTTHTMYPSLLVILDAGGNRIAQYMHAGHMRSLEVLPAAFYVGLARSSGPFLAPPARGQGPALALSAEFQEAPRQAGLVILAPGFRSGAYPAAGVHYRHDSLPPMEDAIYVRTPPSLPAQRCDAGQNWPGKIVYDATNRALRLLTIEEPGGEGILRVFDDSLRQVTVFPTDRFRNAYVSLKRDLGLPEIDSPEMSRSVEITRFLQWGVWVDHETREVWQP